MYVQNGELIVIAQKANTEFDGSKSEYEISQIFPSRCVKQREPILKVYRTAVRRGCRPAAPWSTAGRGEGALTAATFACAAGAVYEKCT